MTLARHHGAFGAVTGWWTSAARVLALVLTMLLAAPVAGFAEDLAFHQGGHGPERTELAMAPDATSDGTRAADPGLGCHIHCGCHVAATLDGAAPVPQAASSRPRYARLSETVRSVLPARLPRPPRA